MCFAITCSFRRKISNILDPTIVKQHCPNRVIATFLLDIDVMFSAYGGVFYAFYIGIVAQCVFLFQCYAHPAPNDQTSLRAYPNVMCGSDVWQNMLIFGAFGFLIFVLGAMSLFIWIIVKAPASAECAF